MHYTLLNSSSRLCIVDCLTFPYTVFCRQCQVYPHYRVSPSPLAPLRSIIALHHIAHAQVPVVVRQQHCALIPTHTSTYAYNTHTHTFIHAHTHAHKHAHLHKHMHTHNTHTHTYTCMHTCINTHKHIHTHTQGIHAWWRGWNRHMVLQIVHPLVDTLLDRMWGSDGKDSTHLWSIARYLTLRR